MFYSSNINSWTGKLLYSDSYVLREKDSQHAQTVIKNNCPFLNRLAKIPLLNIPGGLIRCVLAIIHMVGHALAALFTWDKQHVPHVYKGAVELVRGIIEALPIIGNIFAWTYDESYLFDCYATVEDECNRVSNSDVEPSDIYVKWQVVQSFFIIKVYNPCKVDEDPVLHAYIHNKRMTKEELQNNSKVNLFAKIYSETRAKQSGQLPVEN